jgi:AhpD family alkylhydroperoxidase
MISPAFRERLMLAVTGVNKCRWCTYAHTKEALKSGVDREEINKLLSADFKGCPPDEIPAILYAHHWAESNANPDTEAETKLRDTYGESKADAIHLVLRTIRAGNLSGNSLDYFLYKISFGNWGNP